MAKSTTAQKEGPRSLSPARSALMRVAQNFSVNLAPFPEEQAALTFQTEATSILAAGLTSAETHGTALQLLRDGKRLKRAIDEHWSKVTRWLEDRKKDIRTIAAMDLQAVEPGIAHLSAAILTYEEDERARRRRAEEAQRLENERIAREARDRDIAELERQALAAEQQSEQLSDRERAFVQRCFGIGARLDDERWLNDAAKACGFRQEGYGVLLMARDKIRDALEAVKQGVALRDQVAAVKEAPLEVRQPEVERQLGKVSGTRTVTTWTAECVDYDLFLDRFIEQIRREALGQAAPASSETEMVVDRALFRALSMPNAVAGNDKARALHEAVDRVPGWRHIKKVTKAA